MSSLIKTKQGADGEEWFTPENVYAHPSAPSTSSAISFESLFSQMVDAIDEVEALRQWILSQDGDSELSLTPEEFSQIFGYLRDYNSYISAVDVLGRALRSISVLHIVQALQQVLRSHSLYVYSYPTSTDVARLLFLSSKA